jgi:hypothetical protein
VCGCHTLVIRLPFDRHNLFVSHPNKRLAIRNSGGLAASDREDPMMHSRNALKREPIDRRRMRLIQTMLAFPAAGIIGFAGTALVRGVLSDDTSVAVPLTPGHAAEEDQTPGERRKENPSEVDPDTNRVRAI